MVITAFARCAGLMQAGADRADPEQIRPGSDRPGSDRPEQPLAQTEGNGVDIFCAAHTLPASSLPACNARNGRKLGLPIIFGFMQIVSILRHVRRVLASCHEPEALGRVQSSPAITNWSEMRTELSDRCGFYIFLRFPAVRARTTRSDLL